MPFHSQSPVPMGSHLMNLSGGGNGGARPGGGGQHPYHTPAAGGFKSGPPPVLPLMNPAVVPGGIGVYPLEYGPGYYGGVAGPEGWRGPVQQNHPIPSLQKKPKELDKAMWVGNVLNDTTIAELQAIFEAEPTEEEGEVEHDVPEVSLFSATMFRETIKFLKDVLIITSSCGVYYIYSYTLMNVLSFNTPLHHVLLICMTIRAFLFSQSPIVRL